MLRKGKLMTDYICTIYFDGNKLALATDIEDVLLMIQEFEEENPDDIGRYTVEPIEEEIQ